MAVIGGVRFILKLFSNTIVVPFHLYKGYYLHKCLNQPLIKSESEIDKFVFIEKKEIREEIKLKIENGNVDPPYA